MSDKTFSKNTKHRFENGECIRCNHNIEYIPKVYSEYQYSWHDTFSYYDTYKSPCFNAKYSKEIFLPCPLTNEEYDVKNIIE